MRATTGEQTGDQLPLDGVTPRAGRARACWRCSAWRRFVRVDDAVVDYAVRIVRATRDGPGLAAGAGPRGAIALVRAARAAALLRRAATSSRPTTSSAARCRRCAIACCSRPTRSSRAARVDELLARRCSTASRRRAL